MFSLRSLFRPKRVTLEEQVAVLETLGMGLSPGIGMEQLLLTWSRDEYEKTPYDLLVDWMGGEHPEGDPQGTPISPCVVHFDTECVYDHGDYARVLLRTREMSRGKLPLEDVRDFVDPEKGQVSVDFRLDGQDYHIDPEFNDDWFDMNVVGRLSELLRDRCPGTTLALREPRDQSATVWCATDDQIRALRRKTGIRFHPI